MLEIIVAVILAPFAVIAALFTVGLFIGIGKRIKEYYFSK